MLLEGKKIILGITGSIAAYKAAVLCRLLIKEGATVKVVMTPLAKEFITPVTMATLSQNTVLTDFFKHDDGTWNSHVELGLWADLMLIAPVTANTLAKMAHGVCDNLLLTTYLSAKCPVMFAPAMDLDMFSHPATKNNIQILQSYGNIVIEPAEGVLASGLKGKGRMEEPENIVMKVASFFEKKKFSSKHFLITAGPTYETIDPVRFIGNHSSGKMGYALASELAANGAKVTLVSGPTSLYINHPAITVLHVNTAEEMYNACMDIFPVTHGAIMCAAVADFTPVSASSSKVKRGKENWSIELKPTKDIAAELGKKKKPGQVLVGFALETDNELSNASDKLHRKNLDFIVLNSLKEPGAGFKHDTNKITLVFKDNKTISFGLKPKTDVAKDITEHIYNLFTL